MSAARVINRMRFNSGVQFVDAREDVEKRARREMEAAEIGSHQRSLFSNTRVVYNIVNSESILAKTQIDNFLLED